MFVLLIVQINTGWLTAYRKEQGAHIFAVGFRLVAENVENVRKQVEANCILTSDFGTTAWFAFYLPNTCVAQRDERIRWADTLEPSAFQLRGKLLFVGTDLPIQNFHLNASFNTVELLAPLERKRGPTPIQTYSIVLLDGAKGDVFDRRLPFELLRR